MSNDTKLSAKELFKDYVPEVMEYDPEVDGSELHQMRNDYLAAKEELVEKIKAAKAARKGDKASFRVNIRTENEQV